MAKSVAKKAATKTAKKSNKTVKANKAVAPVATAKAPNPLHAALIKLMSRPEGAAIADFQQLDGFAIPSMAALKIAERAGFKTSAVKKPGERTRYYARTK